MKRILGFYKKENVIFLIYDKDINKKDTKLVIGKIKNGITSIKREVYGDNALNEYKKLKKHYIY